MAHAVSSRCSGTDRDSPVATAEGVSDALADIGGGGVINGYYKLQNGQLRVIDSATDSCRESVVTELDRLAGEALRLSMLAATRENLRPHRPPEQLRHRIVGRTELALDEDEKLVLARAGAESLLQARDQAAARVRSNVAPFHLVALRS